MTLHTRNTVQRDTRVMRVPGVLRVAVSPHLKHSVASRITCAAREPATLCAAVGRVYLPDQPPWKSAVTRGNPAATAAAERDSQSSPCAKKVCDTRQHTQGQLRTEPQALLRPSLFRRVAQRWLALVAQRWLALGVNGTVWNLVLPDVVSGQCGGPVRTGVAPALPSHLAQASSQGTELAPQCKPDPLPLPVHLRTT